MIDVKAYRSPGEAIDQLIRFENTFESFYTVHLFRFLKELYTDATNALTAPVVVASGQVRDPFAWSMVQRRWYATIRAMTDARSDLMTTEVVAMLEAADLPMTAHREVSSLLKTSVAEGWSEWKTKRALSSLLIPKRGKDEPVEVFRVTVRRLARTSANLNVNLRVQSQLMREGFTHKTWVAVMDSRTREDHMAANGQTVPVDSIFTVGGVRMRYPGDPVAPASQTANCRCVLIGSDEGPTREGL